MSHFSDYYDTNAAWVFEKPAAKPVEKPTAQPEKWAHRVEFSDGNPTDVWEVNGPRMLTDAEIRDLMAAKLDPAIGKLVKGLVWGGVSKRDAAQALSGMRGTCLTYITRYFSILNRHRREHAAYTS